MRSRAAIVPVFLPNRGCPGRCIFCDAGAQSGEGRLLTPGLAAPELRLHLVALAARGRPAELAFYGGSFDGLPPAERRGWLDLARALTDEGLVSGGIRVSAHPRGLDAACTAELASGGVSVVEVGVQSLDDRVLEAAGRGHDGEDARCACRRVMDAGMRCVVQLMAGLPAADRASDLSSAAAVAELGVQGARIHPTVALRGTVLADLAARGCWRALDLEEAILRVADMVELLEDARVPVIRLGLKDHPGLGPRIVAGPHHPAFGELVRGELAARTLAGLRRGGHGATPGADPGAALPRSWLLGHGRRGLRRLEELRRAPP